MFLVLIILTGLIAARALVLAYHRSRDIFHPLVITLPMIVALYVLLPLKLYYDGSLTSFFSEQDLLFVQLINLLGIVSYCWGTLVGSGRQRLAPPTEPLHLSPVFRQRVLAGGLILGAVGVAAYAFTIINVGGFYQAYSQAYSGGWSDSGYIRDAVSLCIPGIVFILISRMEKKLGLLPAILLGAFAAPFVIQGVLGARRGPTFLVIAAAGLCWYMVRGRRPRPLYFALVGVCLGMLMLFLVSNREQIYLGSSWNLDKGIFEYLKVEDSNQGTGNEYIYGGGSILNASLGGDFYWGRRYFAEAFVRPIPRQLWPNKYADIGLAQLEENAGTGGGSFAETVGWSGAEGAAPGMVADLWLEFWWLALPALFALGWAYGRVWRLACRSEGEFSTVIYVFMASLSVFLVFQTMEAIMVRFIFMAGSSWLIWRWATAGVRKAHRAQYGALRTQREA